MLVEAVALLTLMAGDDRCPAALAAAPQYTACAEGRLGVALSATQEDAEILLADAEVGEARFRTRFGQDPAPYLVLYFDSDPPKSALEAAGFTTVLAWPSPALTAGLFTESFRRNELAGGAGPLSPEAEARVQTQSEGVIASLAARSGDVVAHELGHTWYEAVFWRASGLPTDGYGTAAPDWLDETSAILMEGDDGAQNRRYGFFRAWAAASPEDRAAPGAIGDLTQFLRRRHPSQTERPTLEATSRAGAMTVSVTTRVDTEDYFSEQVQVFADYLLDRSGNPALFRDITRSLAAGATFENWLASQTGSSDLPSNLPALQRDWIVWAEGPAATRQTSPLGPAAGRR